jgi:hypothetical protein
MVADEARLSRRRRSGSSERIPNDDAQIRPGRSPSLGANIPIIIALRIAV